MDRGIFIKQIKFHGITISKLCSKISSGAHGLVNKQECCLPALCHTESDFVCTAHHPAYTLKNSTSGTCTIFERVCGMVSKIGGIS